MEYTSEKPADPIVLYVYAGKDAGFTLYEDENTNYNYETGKYATIEFKYEEASKKITIEDRKGSFNGMLSKRTFNIILVTKENALPFNLENVKSVKVLKYSGRKISESL
jgi:alpha-D-xyloside xylohydrolase